jgi:hypothetical protein
MFIKTKLEKHGIKVWVAVHTKTFYAYTMQVYTCKTDGAREKKQGLQVAKDVVCHTYGTRRVINADNFLTGCELENPLLTMNTTQVGTLKE